MHHLVWIDLRKSHDPEAFAQASLHSGVDGIVSDDLDLLKTLPPTVTRVAVLERAADESVTSRARDAADVLAVEARGTSPRPGDLSASQATLVEVHDQASLDLANECARTGAWTVIDFRDPTKIPLEIVLAAADGADGRVMTVVRDAEEAGIVFDVLERGSDGVVLAPSSFDDIRAVLDAARASTPALDLAPLTVTEIRHLGLGDRVCVDTCSQLGLDEGILVGSYSSAMTLVSSETHPLPYMPTRPFRVNAGALHSYTLGPDNRTRYLSELGSGSEILAVRTTGETRRVVVGRAKIESRPLLQIRAETPGGVVSDLVVQDDWHVRVLGPDAEVRNVTELASGDRLAGTVLTQPRHVGYAVREFLLEK